MRLQDLKVSQDNGQRRLQLMGYIGISAILFLLAAALTILLLNLPLKAFRDDGPKSLKVTIPENLDYTNIFDDIFEKYAADIKLDHVKTTSMGSLYDLSYTIVQKNEKDEKKMIDELRCRNGNLPISCGRPVSDTQVL